LRKRNTDICPLGQTPGGFTLIEVAIAVAILGAALATLIGYQTRLMDTYAHERNLFRATLAAQYLMTFIEVEQDPPDPGDTESSLEDALQEKGYFDGLETDQFADTYKDWKLTQRVTSVNYAEFEDILRRVELNISWDSGQQDNFSLVLFMNTPTTEQKTSQ
jgi:prepilin-type N-terminal cleavage/methylation domain-containing protein